MIATKTEWFANWHIGMRHLTHIQVEKARTNQDAGMVSEVPAVQWHMSANLDLTSSRFQGLNDSCLLAICCCGWKVIGRKYDVSITHFAKPGCFRGPKFVAVIDTMLFCLRCHRCQSQVIHRQDLGHTFSANHAQQCLWIETYFIY